MTYAVNIFHEINKDNNIVQVHSIVIGIVCICLRSDVLLLLYTILYDLWVK